MIVSFSCIILLVSLSVAFFQIRPGDMTENNWYLRELFFEFLSRGVLVEDWKHQKHINHCHDCSVSDAERSVRHNTLNNRADAFFIWFQKSPDCVDQIHEDSFVRSCWIRVIQAWRINKSHIVTLFDPYQMSHSRYWLRCFKVDWNKALSLSILRLKQLW